MHVIEIPEQDLRFKVPQNVHECTPSQYRYILELYLLMLAGRLSPNQFKMRLAYYFLRLSRDKRSQQKDISEPYRPKFSNLWRVAQLFDEFLTYQPDREHASLNISTINQFFPVILHNGRRYVGCQTALTNITFAQFIHAEAAARKVAATGDEDQLNLLFAILYPRQRWWQRIFSRSRKYVPQQAERQASQQADLPMAYKIAALNIFQSTIEWWNEGPIEINGTEVDLRLLWAGSGKGKGSLTTVLFSLAESGVFGTVKQTAEANLYDVLLRLWQVAQQAKEQEAKNKNKS